MCAKIGKQTNADASQNFITLRMEYLCVVNIKVWMTIILVVYLRKTVVKNVISLNKLD